MELFRNLRSKGGNGNEDEIAIWSIDQIHSHQSNGTHSDCSNRSTARSIHHPWNRTGGHGEQCGFRRYSCS
jgi:hypothetical protein